MKNVKKPPNFKDQEAGIKKLEKQDLRDSKETGKSKDLEAKIKRLEKEDIDAAEAAALIDECVRLAAECGE
jgi:hypothetical protein